MLGNWLQDVALEQADHDGAAPLVLPDVLTTEWPHAPQAIWADAVTEVPWALYEASGDKEILGRQYESMRSWLEKGVQRGSDGLWTEELWQLGDWLDPASPPEEPGGARTDGVLVADAYLVHVTNTPCGVSAVLGYRKESAHYAAKYGD